MSTIVEFPGTDHRACDGLFVMTVVLPDPQDVDAEWNVALQPDA